MKTIRFIQFVLALLFCNHITAQTITGYVFDSKDGEPIIGASVFNGKNGALTDFDGKFTIPARPGDKLTVKYIGFSEKKVPAQYNMEIGMGKGKYKSMKRAYASTSSSTTKANNSSSYSSSARSNTSSEPCYVKNEKTEKDGFKWAWYYDISVSAKWIGAMDANDNILIPATKHFTLVRYHSVKGRKGFFYVTTEDDKEGVYDLSGNEIVAPKYSSVSFSEYDNCFEYEKGDKMVKLPITLDANGRGVRVSASPSSSSSYASSSSSTTNSYSQSSSSSQYGRLLYQGTYTNTGVVRTNTAILGDGNPTLMNFVVYDNVLISHNGNNVWQYVGDVTVYGQYGRKYGNNQFFYLVYGQGNISCVMQQGINVTMLYFDKGDTRYNYNGKRFNTPLNNGGNSFGNNGVNYNNNNYNNTNTRKPRCKTCMGSGRCRNCNGSKLVANAYTRRNEWCEVCHRTGLCPTCKGTGESPFRH